MPLPSTNLKLTDIFKEANAGYTSDPVSLNDTAFYSYFSGPSGSNSVAYNAWGQGQSGGINRIHGLSFSTSPAMGDFRGLTYFYDNSTFQVTLDVYNNLTNPPPPPPPAQPVDNAIDVTIELWSSGFGYKYIGYDRNNLMANSSDIDLVTSETTDPIIFRGYWKVIVKGVHPSFAGGGAIIKINGVTKASGASVTSGQTSTTLTSATYGTADVAAFDGFTGLYFDVALN